ncbi:MAG: hypothetical protein ACFE96_14000 [Candidatus Hermodarchaeota archaeon]
MIFTIPRNKTSEMILYIWKIIEIPKITIDDLMYVISFELFLFPPKEAKLFIKKAVQDGFLELVNNEELRLSRELSRNLESWHISRRSEISKKIQNSKDIIQKIENDDDLSKFNVLLKAFLDKGTINKAVLISDSSIKINKFSAHEKILEAQIKGSQQNPYIVEISAEKKILTHNCHDFQVRRSQEKKFCKHLAKLFLFLKEKDEKGAELILEDISKNINKWDFSS